MIKRALFVQKYQKSCIFSSLLRSDPNNNTKFASSFNPYLARPKFKRLNELMSASFYKNNQLTLYRAKKLSAKKVLKISRMRRECSSWHFANVQKIHLHANHLLKSLRYLIFRYPDSVFKLETDLETDLDFFERRFYSIVGVFTNWILLNSIQNELSEYTDGNFKVHGKPYYIFKNALV